MPSRLSDAFNTHPVNLPHKHLDVNSLQEVPDSFAWAPEDCPTADPVCPESLPLIDLSLPNAFDLVGNACKTWGIFQVINHGVSQTLLNDMEETAQTLFSLPAHEKLKAARSPVGMTGYGRARISSFFQKLMWNEGFTVVGSPAQHFQLLWPHDYSKYCEVTEEYNREMKNLSDKLLWGMLGHLGITKEDIKWADPNGDFMGQAALQLNSYPACPDPDRAMGLAAHTDTTLFTIIHQNNTNGLEMHREETGWVTVDPVPGALVVNLGDLLHIMSNGLYPTVLHRARVNRTRHRISIAYLYGPPESAQISPVKKLLGPTRPALYRAVTWSEYLGEKAKHFNEALKAVRICAPVSGLLEVNDHSRVTVG